MENIISNIKDPSWWFTGMFFVLVAYLLPKVVRGIQRTPQHAKGFVRGIEKKKLLRIKKTRFDDTKIIIEANKVNTWFILFCLTGVVILYNYLNGPFVLFDENKQIHIEQGRWLVVIINPADKYIVHAEA